MPIIKLLKRAELELIDACEWYEKQQKGLSKRLRAEVREMLNIINKNPDLHSQKYKTDQHFAPLKIFPYIIVYWFDENLNTVFITSIFHTKRNPQKFESE